MEAADVALVFVSGADRVTRSQAAENSATTTMTASERSNTSVLSSLLMPLWLIEAKHVSEAAICILMSDVTLRV